MNLCIIPGLEMNVDFINEYLQINQSQISDNMRRFEELTKQQLTCSSEIDLLPYQVGKSLQLQPLSLSDFQREQLLITELSCQSDRRTFIKLLQIYLRTDEFLDGQILGIKSSETSAEFFQKVQALNSKQEEFTNIVKIILCQYGVYQYQVTQETRIQLITVLNDCDFQDQPELLRELLETIYDESFVKLYLLSLENFINKKQLFVFKLLLILFLEYSNNQGSTMEYLDELVTKFRPSQLDYIMNQSEIQLHVVKLVILTQELIGFSKTKQQVYSIINHFNLLSRGIETQIDVQASIITKFSYFNYLIHYEIQSNEIRFVTNQYLKQSKERQIVLLDQKAAFIFNKLLFQSDQFFIVMEYVQNTELTRTSILQSISLFNRYECFDNLMKLLLRQFQSLKTLKTSFPLLQILNNNKQKLFQFLQENNFYVFEFLAIIQTLLLGSQDDIKESVLATLLEVVLSLFPVIFVNEWNNQYSPIISFYEYVLNSLLSTILQSGNQQVLTQIMKFNFNIKDIQLIIQILMCDGSSNYQIDNQFQIFNMFHLKFLSRDYFCLLHFNCCANFVDEVIQLLQEYRDNMCQYIILDVLQVLQYICSDISLKDVKSMLKIISVISQRNSNILYSDLYSLLSENHSDLLINEVFVQLLQMQTITTCFIGFKILRNFCKDEQLIEQIQFNIQKKLPYIEDYDEFDQLVMMFGSVIILKQKKPKLHENLNFNQSFALIYLVHQNNELQEQLVQFSNSQHSENLNLQFLSLKEDYQRVALLDLTLLIKYSEDLLKSERKNSLNLNLLLNYLEPVICYYLAIQQENHLLECYFKLIASILMEGLVLPAKVFGPITLGFFVSESVLLASCLQRCLRSALRRYGTKICVGQLNMSLLYIEKVMQKYPNSKHRYPNFFNINWFFGQFGQQQTILKQIVNNFSIIYKNTHNQIIKSILLMIDFTKFQKGLSTVLEFFSDDKLFIKKLQLIYSFQQDDEGQVDVSSCFLNYHNLFELLVQQ